MEMMYAISCYIGPYHNNTQLYMIDYIQRIK